MHLNSEGKRESRTFLAGLLEWTGEKPPSALEIEGRNVILARFAHIKTILMGGGELIGEVVPWWDWPSEISDDDNIPTAGYNVMNIMAEKHAQLQDTKQDEQAVPPKSDRAGG